MIIPGLVGQADGLNCKAWPSHDDFSLTNASSFTFPFPFRLRKKTDEAYVLVQLDYCQ